MMSADGCTRKRQAEGKGRDGDDESKAVPEARAQPKGRTRPGKALTGRAKARQMIGQIVAPGVFGPQMGLAAVAARVSLPRR